MKNICLLTVFYSVFLFSAKAQAQGKDSLLTQTEEIATPKVTVGGYVDTYFGYDLSRPASKDRPYFVSSARHNEFTINLAFVDVKYNGERVRGAFKPAIGTYMAANYAAEPAMFRNILEANVGIKLFKTKDIWLDAGVFVSPFTNESPVSMDQLAYTRSYAPEYVPYYISGLKLTTPLSEKLTAYVYLLNGWQNIVENNQGKSGALQLEYKPVEKVLLNWNLYVGDERTPSAPINRTRVFTDVFAVFNPNGKFSGTTSLYVGAQQRADTLTGNGNGEEDSKMVYWHNANIIGRYKITPSFSLTGRLEYFNDPNSVQITPVTGVNGFSTFSSSLGINWKVAEKALLRLESRSFLSQKEVYVNKDGTPSNYGQLLIGSMAISF
ncbi:outer membrane beta-barrel protein [Rhodocytophaga aerolata]|uniref:Outer membrane beta-barrel protein n=1 Tax=Rhodocytophaga aerolata TaxID=455078 RepID=A0ABT8RH95_9BACT|nr:outer membrane beta-barrel protein [Rhodocytophaga aerolata]MDO1451469.1 outer membrane beta-barrel protein [Rhodocytophaga aerolata]